MDPVDRAGDAVARARGDLGGGRRVDHHLPRRAAVRAARALRRGRGRRRGHLAQGLARHDPAAARHPLHHADPAGHRDRAGVPRAVPVHRRRSGRRDARRSCSTSTTRRSATASAATTARRPRCRCCSRSCSAILSWLYFKLTEPLEHRNEHRSRPPRPRRACAASCRGAASAAGASATSIDDLAERTIVSDVRAPPHRHAVRDVGDPRLPGRHARDRRPRADPVAREVRGHADAGHAVAAVRAVAERDRLGEPVDRVERHPHRPVLLEHDRHRRGRLVLAAVHRDDRGLRAVGAASAVRADPERARARDAVHPRDRAARAAVPDDREPAAPRRT